MADLFHEEVSFTFLDEVFKTIRNCPQHVFHILSKRSERMLEYASQTDWPFNAVPGVTVESKDYVFRIDHLRQIKAPQRFINMEPLLGPVPAMNLEGITYLDAAPEKGENARPFRKAWALDIERQCGEAGVEFCFRSEKTPLNK
jgi:protein gp37